MKRFLPILFIFILVSAVSAQSDTSPACPTIDVNGPVRFIKPGDTATYSVQIDLKGLQLNPQYIWSVSAGQILKGQGTSSVDVQQTIEALTVTVEVEGLPSGCPNTASETIFIEPQPQAVKLDEFTGPISYVDKGRFGKVTEIVRKNPNGQLVIFVGYQKGAGFDERSSRRQEIIGNLALFRDEDGRITFVDVGDNREIVQFWLVPPGADMPRCEECETNQVIETICVECTSYRKRPIQNSDRAKY